MAENTNVNKVVYGNDTLIDLTQDTVEPSNLLEGETAHDRSGAPVTGTAKQGHAIQDSSGTGVTQRTNLQFKDVHISDDSTNDRTVVETFKAVTQSEYSSETEDGAYIITDGDGATIGPASEDYVEVVGDGSKTYKTLLNELFNGIDLSKVDENSVIVRQAETIYIGYFFYSKTGSVCNFTRSIALKTSDYFEIETIRLATSDSYMVASTKNGYSDTSATDIVPEGHKFILYYGNKKATVDLHTTANRCWLNNGKNVENSIGLKLASSWSQALNQATEYILFVGKGTDSNSTKVTSSIYIPIKALTSTKRYWMNTLYALNSFHIHLQVNISLTEATNIGLYQGTSVISDATYEIYYR